jgi:hypothetical protein
MTEEDLMRVAARYTELVNPGSWHDLTDRQKGVVFLQVGTMAKAFLLEDFLMRTSPVRVLVDQDVNQHQTVA